MFCGVTSTPVLDFWWIAFPTYLIAVQNRFLRPTSSATPTYLLAADSFDLPPLSNIGEPRTNVTMRDNHSCNRLRKLSTTFFVVLGRVRHCRGFPQ